MRYSSVASAIFAVRNADKTENGEIGRLPVTIGQAGAVVKAASEMDNPLSKALSKGLTALNKDKTVNKFGKAVKFASDKVNHLIVASGALKVALADEDKRTDVLIAESGSLAGMFLGEGLMKKHLNKALTSLPVPKKFIPIIKGITFVVGSIGSSLLGEKIAKKATPYLKEKLQLEDDQTNNTIKFAMSGKSLTEAKNGAYEPMNIRA